MMPNLDPSKIQQMMEKMGMDTEEIDAVEVEIKTKTGKLLVKNPSVMKVNVKGKEMLQVEGEFVETEGEEKEIEFTEEDVKTVVEKTGASEEEAKKALEEEGDLAMAVMKLKG
ncbi:MAG: nascent polypeptide-associated complex protein [Candidatus Aenigmatarchaeota archaeon]